MGNKKQRLDKVLRGLSQKDRVELFLEAMQPVILVVEAAGDLAQALDQGLLEDLFGEISLEEVESLQDCVPVAKGGCCQDPAALPAWNRLFDSMMQDPHVREAYLKTAGTTGVTE
ncbi:MAG: hypothetical protein HC898_01065 [Phycisphaerales bacterium]|nr:hypothetical protein [Phycisphaerales bacterium]